MYLELQHKYHTLDDKFFTKSVTTEGNWVFKVDVQSGIDVRTFPSVGSIQRGQLKHQAQNHDAFSISTVAIAQCIIICENTRIWEKHFIIIIINIFIIIINILLLSNAQAYGLKVSCIRHLANDDTLQSSIMQR